MRKRRPSRSPWPDLRLFGAVGWTIALSILLGFLAGSWLDENLPASFSWKVVLILVGAGTGYLGAWQALKHEEEVFERQKRRLEKKKQKDTDDG
jgi:predicted F0F1-ATPase subunit